MRAFLGCLALLVAVNAAAQVYRWTDEKGRVVYGNEPPPGAKSSAVQNRINSYSGPPEVQRAAAVAPRRVRTSRRIASPSSSTTSRNPPRHTRSLSASAGAACRSSCTART